MANTRIDHPSWRKPMFCKVWIVFKSAQRSGNMKSRILILIAVMTLCNALIPSFLDAQNVIQRRRLGSNTEAMTAIHAGRLNNYIVLMDGTDVLAFANGGRERVQRSCSPPPQGR